MKDRNKPSNYLEDSGIRVKGDSVIGGQEAKDGAKITSLSTYDDYQGSQAMTPPISFEALMLKRSLTEALLGENIKKELVWSTNPLNNLKQLEVSSTNKFMDMCQHGMAAIIFSAVSLEAWANHSIELLGRNQGKSSKVKYKEKEYSTDGEAQRRIPIKDKLFNTLPQVFSVKSPTGDRTKKPVEILVEQRNICIHMKSKIKEGDVQYDRKTYGYKLYKDTLINYPKAAATLMSYYYDKYQGDYIEKPEWLKDIGC